MDIVGRTLAETGDNHDSRIQAVLRYATIRMPSTVSVIEAFLASGNGKHRVARKKIAVDAALFLPLGVVIAFALLWPMHQVDVCRSKSDRSSGWIWNAAFLDCPRVADGQDTSPDQVDLVFNG